MNENAHKNASKSELLIAGKNFIETVDPEKSYEKYGEKDLKKKRSEIHPKKNRHEFDYFPWLLTWKAALTIRIKSKKWLPKPHSYENERIKLDMIEVAERMLMNKT